MTSRKKRRHLLLVCVATLLGCGQSASEKTTSDEVDTSTDSSATEDAAEPEVQFKPAPDGKVLRHAVFFSFKESSTKDDVQSVVDAFCELPSKIDAIVDFEWGVNNSPEELDDGFTHCFLLTFKDEAGRAEYIPHPAHSGEFADVLRPHMKDVFVIDYWGDANMPVVENPLRHAVFFRFKEDATAEDIGKVEEAFAELPSKIEEIKAFEWGTNNSPESNDDGFSHCFFVTFDSDDGRAAYLPHEDHMAFVEVLKPHLDAPRVLDYFAKK